MKISWSAIVLLIVIFSASIVGCDNDPNPNAPATAGIIVGKVAALATGEALASVSMTTVPPTHSVYTDVSGVFRLENVTPAVYSITASTPGYLPKTVHVQVHAGKTTIADIRLEKRAEGSSNDGSNRLSLDGASSYGLVDHTPSLNISEGDVTIEAWVYPIAHDNWNWVLAKGGSNANAEYLLGLQHGQIIFYSRNENKMVGKSRVGIGQWHHIAAVQSRSQGKVYLYLDGVLDGTFVLGGKDVVTSKKLFIGAREYFNSGGPSEFFDGFIHELRLWDVERSESEINAAKDTRLTGREPGLVGYWPMNEGQGSTLQDMTGHGHDCGLRDSFRWLTIDGPIK